MPKREGPGALRNRRPFWKKEALDRKWALPNLEACKTVRAIRRGKTAPTSKRQKRKAHNPPWPNVRREYGHFLGRGQLRKPGDQTNCDGAAQARARFSATKRP